MKAKLSTRITMENRTALETVIPLSTPYLVFLDPSNFCNAKCSWCPTGSGAARKYHAPQLMRYTLYQKIIDDLCKMPDEIKVLRLYKEGEPLVNPWFPDMVSYAAYGKRFNQIDTTTNGILLTPTLSIKLIQAGLNKIFISIPPVYSRVKYTNQIREFFRLSRGSCRVFVKILDTGMDERKKDTFFRDFGDICDEIAIENIAACWPGMDVEGTTDKGVYGQPIRKEVSVCPYIFYSVAINSDGTVSLCFLDWRHLMIMGDLKTESFKDVWNGKKLYDQRILNLQHQRKYVVGCRRCGQLSCGAPDDIDQYSEAILERLR